MIYVFVVAEAGTIHGPEKQKRQSLFRNYAQRNVHQSPQVHGRSGGSWRRCCCRSLFRGHGEARRNGPRREQTERRLEEPLQYHRKRTPFNDITNYNNFYEFSTDKDEPAKRHSASKTRPWTVQVDGLVNKPKTFDIDDFLKTFAIGRAHLPPSLRRRLVDGHSLGRVPAQQFLKEVEPHAQSEVRRVHHRLIRVRCPVRATACSTGPTSKACGWTKPCIRWRFWPSGLYGEDIAEAGRRADPPGRAVEVRLQEHQVDREDHASSRSSRRPRGTQRTERIRFLFQRESERRSSALEPGERAAHRRVLQARRR